MKQFLKGVLQLTFYSYVNEERNKYGADSSINCSLGCSGYPP